MPQTERHYDVDAFNAVMAPDVGAMDVAVEVEGALPDALRGGTYLLNGPAMVKLGGRLMHPFDGHGFVRAVRFDGPVPRLQARFVDTPEWRRESAEGRARFRGIGTRVGDSFLSNAFATMGKNPANTCIQPWAGRLLALNEGGLPYALDPDTLETRGLETFGGALEGQRTFLAHTRVDAARGRLVGMSLRPGSQTRFTFFEFDAEGRQVAGAEHACDGMVFLHDFAITPTHHVVLENPVTLSVPGLARMLVGAGSLIELLAFSDRPARLILVPRDGGPAQTVDLGRSLFAVHHAGAFEEDGRLVIDTAIFDAFAFGSEFGFQGPDRPLDPGVREPGRGQHFTRFTVELGSGAVQERRLSDWSLDFPRVHPAWDGRRHRFVHAATSTPQGANDPFTALISLDLDAGTEQIWSAGAGCFVGEPVFAPTPGSEAEDGGHILAVVYDGRRERCFLGVFEPGRVDRGPVARVHLPGLLPYGFHGSWASAGV